MGYLISEIFETSSNSHSDTPIVECLEDKIRLRMNTQVLYSVQNDSFKKPHSKWSKIEFQRPFHGRIFVKGMSAKAGCSHNYINNSGTKIIYELENGACNMRRRRMVGLLPRQFQFLTQNPIFKVSMSRKIVFLYRNHI